MQKSMPDTKRPVLQMHPPKKRCRLLLSASLFLTLFLCLLLFAGCAEQTTRGALVLEKFGDGYMVKSIGDYTGKDVSIPETHSDGLPITAIGPNAFAGSDIRSVTLPKTITSINENAFMGCRNLSKVTSHSTAINLIGKNAFADTPYVRPGSSGDWENGILYLGNCVVIADEDLCGDVIVRDGTLTFAYFAFANTDIEKITIPAGMFYSGTYTFMNCRQLRQVTFLGDIGYLGDGLFYGCTALADFSLPNQTSSIGKNCFFGCRSLKNFKSCASLSKIGPAAFSGCTSLVSLSFSEALTTIDKEAFLGCTALRTVSQMPNLTTVGAKAFFDCTSLTKIDLPQENVKIGALAFHGCPAMTAPNT